MKILSLYTHYPSSACLIINNKLVAATHEERFTRVKNEIIFPSKAIKYCLRKAGIKAKDLDYVALASFISPFDDTLTRKNTWSVKDYLKEQNKIWKPYLVDKIHKHKKSVLEVFPKKINWNMYPKNYWKKNYKVKNIQKKFLNDREKIVAKFLGIDKSKVIRLDHHTCHAFYSYYASPFVGKKVLALTVDGFGDGLNSTIGVFDKKGNYKRFYKTNMCAIARIYRYMTLLLGMKPNEHEYKMMGLAPYGRKKYASKALEVFKSTLTVEGIKFKWKVKPSDSYFWFKKKLEGERFDNIAWAVQTWVEELLVKWVKNCIKKFKISNVAISGGVALNVKAMGKISQQKEVKNLFVGGSASDESLALSAGINLLYNIAKNQNKEFNLENFSRIDTLYLGPENSFEDEKNEIKKLKRKKLRIFNKVDHNVIAKYLSKGKIIARCSGRMEFGQRALGNRSILADPRKLEIKEKINSAIKNRDFWMPFAPVIQKKLASKYLINPKNIQSPHMTIGFQTTKEGYKNMIAACHPADKSARAQILEKKHNPKLYDIIEKFREITGVGALLNTSFNLHGFPIVNNVKDALYVFKNSDLDGLILNNFFILKK